MARNYSDFSDCNRVSKQVRHAILLMHAASGSSHIGSSLSVADILVALYLRILNITPSNLAAKNRDRLILSKGHAASALFACLAARGFIPKKTLGTYCMNGGILPGHSSFGCVSAVEITTGSLGHGLSVGAGMALAAKHDRLKHRVFVILSDGECQEGSVWEAAMFAGHHKMNNLVAIVDYNKLQAFGRIKEIMDLEPFAKKWQSFGWSTQEVDGHNFRQLLSSMNKLPFTKNKPSLIIAHTTKGKGVSFMEDQLAWHYKSPNQQQLNQAFFELGNL